jgi:MFS family permease
VLDSDAIGYGFLMTAAGLGAVVAAVGLAFGGRPKPIRIALGPIVLGVASMALAWSGSYPLSLALMPLVGGGGIAMAATANATIQLAVPDGLRGRVMSVYTTVFSASMPIGGLLMGAVASAAGIAVAIALGGILSLATGLLALVWWARIRAVPVGGSAALDQARDRAAGQLPEVQASRLVGR